MRLGEAGRELGALLSTAGRLLVSYGPQLVALYLVGAIGRESILWLAAAVTNLNSTLGVLLVPLAPLGLVVCLVMMMRTCGEFLPAFRSQFGAATPRERLRSNLVFASRMLIPFLALYASQGFLYDDAMMFLRSVTLEEVQNRFFNRRFDRVLMDDRWTLAIVVIGLAARKLIGRHRLAERSLGWAAVGGYVEALWLVTLGNRLAAEQDTFWAWVEGRRFVAPFLPAWEAAQGWLADASAWVRLPSVFVESLVGQAGPLIVVPIAWLAMGATVFGAKLQAEEISLTHEATARRIAAMPQALRRLLAQGVDAALAPFQDTWLTIRRVTRLGILPMVGFCLLFATVGQVPVLVAWVGRWITGPRDWLWQNAVYPWLAMAERGAYLIVALAVLTAAVHVLVADEQPTEAPAEAEAPEAAAVAAPDGVVTA